MRDRSHRSRVAAFVSGSLAALWVTSAAQAQAPPASNGPADAAPKATPGTTVDAATPSATEEVRVHGRSSPISRGASDFNLRLGELHRVHRANAGEMLKLAPGVLLANDGGEGHAQQVFMRGFDAREGQDIEFSVGGVPINEAGNLHGNGYADTHFVIPELVESLRVIEGPFDPHQGNFAVAGSANYELGLPKRGFIAQVRGGSFGTQRLLLLFGPKEESAHTFGGVELYRTDGFGRNRAAERGSAIGQYEGRLGPRSSFRVTGQAYTTKYFSAGVVRNDDFRAGKIGFYDTYDPRQGGSSSRYSLAGDIEAKSGTTTFTQQVFLIARDMRLLENFTGFLQDTQEQIQSPHAQRGDLLDLSVNSFTVGARGSARMRGTAFGQRQEIEFGYYARGDKVSASQQRLEDATGVPYKTETSLASSLGDIGLFADTALRATRWLSFRGGTRADVLTYDVDDLCAVTNVSQPSRSRPPGDESCLTQSRLGKHREANQRSTTVGTAFMPRGSLIVGPIQKLSLSLSYGQGVRSIDPQYITQDVRTPFAQIAAYEGGVSYAGGTKDVSIVARSILFRTHVDRDLVFSQSAGRNVLAQGTTRTGWVGALRVTGPWFDQAANVTLVRSTFDDTQLLVPYVPDVVVRSDSAVFADLPITIAGKKLKGALSAGITFVGQRPLPFSQRSQSIFTVDASATVGWSLLELGITAANLFDRSYRLSEYNYASVFQRDTPPTLVPTRHFTAGSPRALFATFTVHFGGDP